MPWKTLLLAVLFSALGLGAGMAGDKVRAALYVGQNEALPAGSEAAPPKLHQQLQDVFGFAHYRLVKEQEFSSTTNGSSGSSAQGFLHAPRAAAP